MKIGALVAVGSLVTGIPCGSTVLAAGSHESVSERAVSRVLIPVEHLQPTEGDCRIVHDYGESVLVESGVDDTCASPDRVHQVPSIAGVGFRGWHGTAAPMGGTVTEHDVVVLRLIGPLDPEWRTELEAAGVEILAPADPHALVVRTRGADLERVRVIRTSEGLPVVLGFAPLPLEARMHRSLHEWFRAEGSAETRDLTVSDFDGRSLSTIVKSNLGPGGSVRSTPDELRRLLEDHPEIGYVEPVFSIQLHNNLVARTNLLAVEPLWDLGYSGEGVVVSHNDSGVDLTDPDLAETVIAVSGRMAYTDTAHGTHTAGSIVGRGSAVSPENTSGCGDLTVGLTSFRGMAWGARIAANNIFEEGLGEVDEMMAWGAQQGAHISSNSWGLFGLSGPDAGYSRAAVEADAAVRDADPQNDGAQPLTIFFSAGNTGPEAGTVTSPGTAKNVITIGATQNDRCGAWVPEHQSGPDPAVVLESSARGPSQGRVKPDIAAPGSDVLSLESGDAYAVQPWDEVWTGSTAAVNTGTSQACAVAAGGGAVLHEILWRTRGRRPSPALIKAALVVAATPGPEGFDFSRGWGRADVAGAADAARFDHGTLLDQDETMELATGVTWSGVVHVRSASEPLGLALVWTDVPGEEDADHPLVNDLDLILTSPSGTVYRGNLFSAGWSTADPGTQRDADNNVEVVRVSAPEPGTWIAEVVGVDVPVPPPGLGGQDFVLAVSGDAAPCAQPPQPPAAVEASHQGDNKIRVSWSPVGGATRYEISRSLVAGGLPFEPIATVPAGSGQNSYLDTEASGWSEYHYVVRAYRDCWSEYSDEVSATAPGPCLLPPVFGGIRSVEAVGRVGCALELSWDPAEDRCPGVELYTIYRGDHAGFELDADSLLVDGVVNSRWLDTNLEWGREYFYVVRANQHGQDFDDGNTVELSGRPTGPSDLYLDEDVEGELDGWIRMPGSETDTGTEPWVVTENDAWAGDRAWFVADEDRVKDQVLLTTEPIEIPVGRELILEFRHWFRLEQGRDGGLLEYSTNGGLDWIDIADGDGQTVPNDDDRWLLGGYTDTIGAPNNPLFLRDGWTGDSQGWVLSRADLTAFAGRPVLLRWRMACDDTPGTGYGWWLDEIRIVKEHQCLSCWVGGIPPAPLAQPTAEGVLIEWDEVFSAEAYRLSRAPRPDGPFEPLALVAAPETSHHDTTVSGGVSYSYVYSALFDECATDHSETTTVTAGGPCRSAPAFWGLDRVIDRREPGCALDLEWRPAAPGCPGAGVGYRIHRSEEVPFVPGPDTLIADGVHGVSYRDLTVEDNEVVHYQVRAVDETSLVEETNPVVQSGWTTGPDEVQFSDSVEGGLDAFWNDIGSNSDSGTEPWVVVDDAAHTGSRSWFCRNEARVKDQVLGLTDDYEITDETMVLSFFHLYDLESFWDGGRFEYSTDGGSSWHDILQGDGSSVGPNDNRFISGGYTGFISVGTGNPLAGSPAWTGFDIGWTETVVDLADLTGLTVRFRWRLGCDRSDARVGWWVDDVELRTTSHCELVAVPPPRRTGARHP